MSRLRIFEFLYYCYTSAKIALNMELPLIMVVSASEFNFAKSSASLSVLKQPLS